MDERRCLQCNEREGVVRESQRRREPLHCASVDYFGEVEWELPRHRFKDWTTRELVELWRILPEHVDKYRRITSAWDIDARHREDLRLVQDSPISETGDDRG